MRVEYLAALAARERLRLAGCGCRSGGRRRRVDAAVGLLRRRGGRHSRGRSLLLGLKRSCARLRWLLEALLRRPGLVRRVHPEQGVVPQYGDRARRRGIPAHEERVVAVCRCRCGAAAARRKRRKDALVVGWLRSPQLQFSRLLFFAILLADDLLESHDLRDREADLGLGAARRKVLRFRRRRLRLRRPRSRCRRGRILLDARKHWIMVWRGLRLGRRFLLLVPI